MGANLDITEKLQNYINDFGLNLHPVQHEIINYNKTLGEIKRMQIDPTQCHFLHLIIKISSIKNVLEIGTFTGLSSLSISLALPDDGKLITLDKNKDIKLAVNWITGELFAVLNSRNIEISQSPISAKNLAILINLIKNGTISGKIAKTVFELMMDGNKDPQKIVEEKGLKQQSDPKALEALIDKIINDNREKAVEYKQGKEKLFGFFVGQAMKASGGKANPQLINEILKKKL